MPRYAWWLVGGTWAAFMVIFALTTFPNHYNFRSAALDLAYSMQVMEYHLRGHLIPRKLSMALFNDGEREIYTDPHASPSMITALPFYAIGGVWGLLLHQCLSIGFAAIGFFAYAYRRTGLWQAAYWTMLHFFGMWGIMSLLAFDWHDVVTGIVWLPWFFYAIEARKRWLLFLSWILFIGAKENFTLWGIWISAWLLLIYRSPEQRRWLVWNAVLAAAWFIISLSLYKSDGGSVSRLSLYGYLSAKDPVRVLQGGDPPSEFSLMRVAKSILLRPQLLWTLLFESPHADSATFGIKSELHWTVLWSGGWSFVFQPIFLVVLLPVYFYKLLSIDYQIWGTLYHYNMEFAVVLPIAVLWTAEKWRGSWKFWGALAGGALSAHIMNLSLLDHRYSKWYDPARHRWYQCEHYKPLQGYRYRKIHEGLRIIPRDAAVSASSRLASHIPARYEYYHFPAVKGAEYIALLRDDPGPWPLSPLELAQYIDSLERSPHWQKVWDRDQLVIFHRRKPTKGS